MQHPQSLPPNHSKKNQSGGRLHEISPEKRQLLALLLKKKAGKSKPSLSFPRLERRPGEAVTAPLTAGQLGLWSVYRYDRDSAVYNSCDKHRLLGAMDSLAMENSLDAIMARHEMLRTRIAVIDGDPVQIIAPHRRRPLPLIDLSGVDPEQRQELARDILDREGVLPFQLERGPLFRFLCLRLAPREHGLALTIHHIAGDGWSTGVFKHELRLAYEAHCHGRQPHLPKLDIQYGDFALWRARCARAAEQAASLDFWKRELRNAPLLELPTDRPRPRVRSFRGDFQSIRLDLATREGLRGLAEEENATFFMVLLALYHGFLMRYSGQTDILVGVPVSNRALPEIEPLIGLFVNTLVMRANLGGDPTFRALLRHVRETALRAYAHADVPFEQLATTLMARTVEGYSPLFQAMFVLQDAPIRELSFPGLQQSHFQSGQRVYAKFDVTLSLWEPVDGLAGGFELNADLFGPATAARMARHFQNLALAAVAHPDRSLSGLNLLAPGELDQILNTWNRPDNPLPPGAGLTRQFEGRCEEMPERVALVFGEHHLTYAVLNERVNGLADHLRSRGVGREDLVGLCLDRSAEMVIGLWAVLKVGGAYLPLDPEYPAARLTYMLADAKPAALLIGADFSLQLPSYSGHKISLERPFPAAGNPETPAHPSQLAYAIYTSGSTGHPKGVGVMRRSLINLLCSMTVQPGFHERDILLAVTTLSFDIASAELNLPLLTGGRLVLASREVASDGRALAAELERRRITVMQATPAGWRLLVYANWRGNPHLKAICGGEALPPDLARDLLDRCASLWNLYGPTETTIWSSAGRVLPPAPPHEGNRPSIHIGTPVERTQFFILDKSLQVCSPGMWGMLYIGGAGLARGYLGLQQLTAQKFLPNPFACMPGQRLYETGDRVRGFPGGAIEIQGREDHQIKLRGFRVELGEIETALTNLAGVREAVCQLRRDTGGEPVLVAYLLEDAGSGSIAGAALLREQLADKLPRYMLPAAFVRMEQWPLTPSGKIDRASLPPPETIQPENAAHAARSPLEEAMIELWGQTLGVDNIGISDHFFQLGGHSLLATKLVTRIRQTLGIELDTRLLFQHPTIAKLIPFLKNAGGSRADATLAIPRSSRAHKPPLSFGQRGLWFLSQLRGNQTDYNIGAALDLRGDLDVACLEQALAALTVRHESLRTRFVTEEERPWQDILKEFRPGLALVDLTGLQEPSRQREKLALTQAKVQQPFTLDGAPPWSSLLLQAEKRAFVFVLSMHHIISDAWSLGILTREFPHFYGLLLASSEKRDQVPPAPLPIQFADFAIWQRRRLSGDVLQSLLDYWRNELTPLPPQLSLPEDLTPSTRTSNAGAGLDFQINESLGAKLKTLSYRMGTTHFMTMLAGYVTLLSHYSGQDDFVVGVPAANRDQDGLEGIVGYFVNTLALRFRLSGLTAFAQVLSRVREVALGAFAHGELPFEKLVEELQPDRRASHSPLFQTAFLLQNAPLQPIRMPGLRVERRNLEAMPTPFDLVLVMDERPGGGFAGFVQYDPDRCNAKRVAGWVRSFETILEQVAGEPEIELAALRAILVNQERNEESEEIRKMKSGTRDRLKFIRRKGVKVRV